MMPFAVGMVRAFLWVWPLVLAFLAARARPGRVRQGLFLAGVLGALLVKPLFLGLGLLVAGFLLGLWPSGGRGRAAS